MAVSDSSLSGDGKESLEQAGVPVTFTDLHYAVPVKKKKTLTILSGISGDFKPGHLTALMGASGSGKTTLMDILAGRKRGLGKIEGEVLFGGAVVPQASLRHLCGYVEQFDTLVDELTVDQMLMYTAELKLSRKLSQAEKQQRCDEVISLLRLEKCRSTVIGNVLQRGISGGQAKRVNIALAMITRPKVVFLDEPTSGLDSRMANEVCLLLKGLAKEGATVVATIHAPSSFAFSLFDSLLMLHGGGQTMYFGPVSGARPHFEACGQEFPEGGLYSLPDWLVDTTCGAVSDVLDKPRETTDFVRLWAESKGAEHAAAHALVVSKLKANPANLKSLPTRGPGQAYALRTLLAYRMSTHYRSAAYLGPRFGDKVFMSLLILSLYWRIGDKADTQSVQSVAAILFFFVALCGFGAAAYVPSLTLERSLFYRERSDGCYSAVTYYLSKFIEEAVLCIFTSLVFSVVVFFALRLQGSFLVFSATYFLTSMVGIVLAYAVAAVAPNMEIANSLLPVYVTTCMYFGGLFLVFEKIPIGWQWYSWTSFLRYAWGALMLNQFKDQATGTAPLFWDSETKTNQDVLQFYGLDEGLMNDITAVLGILAGLCVVFGVFGALCLTFVSHVKR